MKDGFVDRHFRGVREQEKARVNKSAFDFAMEVINGSKLMENEMMN